MTMRASAYILVIVLVLSGASARRDLTTTYSTHGECRATGLSGKYAHAYDAYAEAIKKATEIGCSYEGEYEAKQVLLKYKTSFSEWAKAIVHVYAFAFAKCSVVEGTTGCAAAEAYATKAAEAQVAGYASASAIALNSCPGCDPAAVGKVVSNLIVEITAAARARAKADVCISYDGTVVDKARLECWAEATAQAAATSLAKAMISGNCYALKAHIKVQTWIDINTAPKLCACEGWVSQGQGTKEPLWLPKNPKNHCEFHEYVL